MSASVVSSAPHSSTARCKFKNKRDGFHELDSYSNEEINRRLQRLFGGELRSARKGTLYGIL